MTNREWLESLSTKDLAAFFTTGLLTRATKTSAKTKLKMLYVEHGINSPQTPMYRNVYAIVHQEGYSIDKLSKWLNEPQEYEVAEKSSEQEDNIFVNIENE